jgi:hypothetical protein
MGNKRTMWALGLCAIPALALTAVANANVTCPTGAAISCSAPPSVSCNGDVTSDNPTQGLDCTPTGPGVNASCNDPAAGGTTNNIIATHGDIDPTPSSCTWACTDADETVNCSISDSNSDLPVTLQKFSVD